MSGKPIIPSTGQGTRQPRAFISQSLRPEDEAFAGFVARLVRHFGFEPMGTVGKREAAPRPIWEQMRDGIKTADCIVLAATPRYLQQDVHDRERTGKGISEQLHVEVGMAVMADRPILAFVEEGTNVGAFLPGAGQYIVLRPGDQEDLKAKWPLIVRYFENALTIIRARWQREKKDELVKAAGIILGGIGALAVLDAIFPDDGKKKDFWDWK